MPLVYSKHEAGASVYFGRIPSSLWSLIVQTLSLKNPSDDTLSSLSDLKYSR